MTRRGWLLFGALGVIWGVPYLLIRVAVADLDPAVVAGGRTIIGGLLLLPIALRRNAFAPLLRHWRVILLYTVVEIVGPWWLLGWAEIRITSSTAGLLIAAVPLIAALIGLRRERLSATRATGLLVGFAGVATLVGLDIDLSNLTAVGAVLLAAVGYAVGAHLIGSRLADLPPLGVITSSLLTAGVIYLPLVIAHWPAHVPADAGWSVVGLAVLCTVAAFLLLFALVAEVGSARATVITYVNPAVAILLGFLILSEPLTGGVVIGFVLIVVGAILATSRRQAARPTPVATPTP